LEQGRKVESKVVTRYHRRPNYEDDAKVIELKAAVVDFFAVIEEDMIARLNIQRLSQMDLGCG